MSNKRSEILARISKASSYREQANAVMELDAYDKHQAAAVQLDRDLDWANTVVTATLAPVPGHEVERNPHETGWLGEFEAANDPNARHAVLAEASMWFDRVSPEVRADSEEFGIQAEGFMRREASKHGLQQESVYQAGLAFIGNLWRQSASGLPQVQQTYDGHDNPSATPLPQDVFDNFAPAVAPDNEGVVGTESSDRAPLIQQLMQQGGGQGQAEWPSQHSESADFSNSYGTVPPGTPQDASSGPLMPQDDEDRDYSNPEFGTATASLVDGPSVAINQTLTLDDFRHQAASGLDEVQQTVDPKEDPAPTPLPQDVMYPWLIGPDAYGNGSGQQQAKEGSIPFGRSASRKEAGGYEPPVGQGPATHYVLRNGEGAITKAFPAADVHRAIGEINDKGGSIGFAKHHPDGRVEIGLPGQEHGNMWEPMVRPDGLLGGPGVQASRKQAAGGPTHYVRYNEHGGVEDSQPADRVNSLLSGEQDANGWKYEQDEGGVVHASTPNGVHFQYHPYPRSTTPAQQAYLDAPRKNKQAAKEAGVNEDFNDYFKGDGDDFDFFDHYHNMGDGKQTHCKTLDHCPSICDHTSGNCTAHVVKEGARKQADMFGGEDLPHDNVPQPDVANTPDTTPNEQAGYAEGRQDALSGERPTFADASTGAPGNVSQYSKGYSDASGDNMPTNPDVPHSLSNQASLVFTSAATAQHPDFVKGYAFAAKWRPGNRLVTLGSGKFEEGLYAGLADYPTHREAWRAAHRRQASKNPQLGQRTAQHDAYTDYLASQGIDVLAPKQAGTSTDLESTGPGSSASPTGDTFINGPGQTPPLAGESDPAAPGGPAPYNGAEPFGTPAVPNGPTAPPARQQTINDLPGGPVDQNRPMDNPTLAAFRKRVAANLAAQKG